jgi:glyoxylase-like metal-dependent hydrolase (beta-lactamase superfamily II)
MPNILKLEKESKKLKNIFMITGEGLSSNIYVIDKSSTTLVDTGIGNNLNPIWPQLNEIGVSPKDIEKVILTHSHHDHAMGLFRILEKTKPTVYLHKKASQKIRTHMNNLILVEDNDLVDASFWPLKILWTPGHTEGSICLYVESEEILFSGDTVFPGGGFGRFDWTTNGLEKITNSLSKLRKIDVDIMLPGHGQPVFSHVDEHIHQSYQNALRLSKMT